jgi:hypothetical protein
MNRNTCSLWNKLATLRGNWSVAAFNGVSSCWWYLAGSLLTSQVSSRCLGCFFYTLKADSFPGNIRSMAIETPIDAKLILDTALKKNMDLLKRNCRPRGFLKYGYPKTVSISFNTNSWSKLVEWLGRFGVPQWLRKPPFVHCKDRIIPCTQGQKWFGGWNPGSQHKWAAQFTDKAMVVKGPSLRHRFNDYFSIFC